MLSHDSNLVQHRQHTIGTTPRNRSGRARLRHVVAVLAVSVLPQRIQVGRKTSGSLLTSGLKEHRQEKDVYEEPDRQTAYASRGGKRARKPIQGHHALAQG